MSDRERIYQLLDVVPEYKIGYVIAYLQGITEGEDVKPNRETLEAFAEADQMRRTGTGSTAVLGIDLIILMIYGTAWRNHNAKRYLHWTL